MPRMDEDTRRERSAADREVASGQNHGPVGTGCAMPLNRDQGGTSPGSDFTV
jgi:hypothetical protein